MKHAIIRTANFVVFLYAGSFVMNLDFGKFEWAETPTVFVVVGSGFALAYYTAWQWLKYWKII